MELELWASGYGVLGFRAGLAGLLGFFVFFLGGGGGGVGDLLWFRV